MKTDHSWKSTLFRFLFLLLEGGVYIGGLYLVQLFNLLHFDGVAPWWQYALVSAASGGAVFGLSFAGRRGELGTGRRLRTAAAQAAVFLAIAVIPLALLERVPAGEGYSIYWMPTEWIKLPRAIIFGLKISFPFFVLFAMLELAGLFGWLKSGNAAYMIPGIAACAAVTAYCMSLIEMDSRGAMYLVAMGAPAAIALAGCLAGREFVAARSIVFMLPVYAVLPFYFGVVPYIPDNPARGETVCSMTPGCDMSFGVSQRSPAPGALRRYPAPGETAGFPLAFMRKFYFDTSRRLLFSSYGPTCGFIRFDGSDMEVMEYRSLIRYIWSEDRLDYMLAPDWIGSEMLFLDKERFEITRRRDLKADRVRVPMDMAADDDFIYLLSTEPPALIRYRKDTFEFAGHIDFKEEGLTPHSHGAYAFALFPERRVGVVQLGVYDLSGRFRVVRVDLDSFSPSAHRDVRTGSILMTPLPSKGTFLMYDYYWRGVTEVDLATLEPRRRFDGVVNCRAAAWDPARDMLYMAGSGFGELAAIDYESGKTAVNYFIGNRAGSMVHLPETDTLIAGSGSGIYSVDLNKFTGITKKE